ncbi:MAG TPA: CsbD family protein [Gemmataceae bacterium]
MNWDVLKGQWKQMTGKLKAKWGKLTDDDLTLIGGKKDELVGKLQERYGYNKDQAEKEADDFLVSMDQP